MNTSQPILEFQGEYRFLSNFWPCIVLWQGREWPSAEHAYQAMKTDDPAKRELIRSASAPGTAKRMAKNLRYSRAWWDGVKYAYMLGIVRAKFAKNPELQEKLLATGSAVLEEGNWWGDTYWGISPAGSSKGENNLGKILMQVRGELTEEPMQVRIP